MRTQMHPSARPALRQTRQKPLSARVLQRLLRQLDERERELQAKIADERHRVQSEGLSQLENEVGDDIDRAFGESLHRLSGAQRTSDLDRGPLIPEANPTRRDRSSARDRS